MKVRVNTDALSPHTEDDSLTWVLATVDPTDPSVVDIDASLLRQRQTSTRDKVAAEVIRESLLPKITDWRDVLQGYASQAFSEGADAHSALYTEATGALNGALAYMRRAADIMDPDITNAEDYE